MPPAILLLVDELLDRDRVDGVVVGHRIEPRGSSGCSGSRTRCASRRKCRAACRRHRDTTGRTTTRSRRRPRRRWQNFLISSTATACRVCPWLLSPSSVDQIGFSWPYFFGQRAVLVASCGGRWPSPRRCGSRRRRTTGRSPPKIFLVRLDRRGDDGDLGSTFFTSSYTDLIRRHVLPHPLARAVRFVAEVDDQRADVAVLLDQVSHALARAPLRRTRSCRAR